MKIKHKLFILFILFIFASVSIEHNIGGFGWINHTKNITVDDKVDFNNQYRIITTENESFYIIDNETYQKYLINKNYTINYSICFVDINLKYIRS
jgi:hypothetical protein